MLNCPYEWQANEQMARNAGLTPAEIETIAGEGDLKLDSLTIGWFSLLSLFLNGTRVPLETTDKIGGRTAPLG